MNTHQQDSEDMARLRQGHSSALNSLMERHGQKVFGYLLRSLQNEQDAADLAQETFVRVYQNRDRFDPDQNFVPWLYSIATNLVRDRFRWRSRHPQVSLEAPSTVAGESIKERLPDSTPVPSDAMQKAERSEAVRVAIATLPEELRQPLILALYEELPQAEIGKILGCSAKAVETRIYRARARLREVLGSFLSQ